MSTIDDFVTANATYAETAHRAGLDTVPQRNVLVVTCMDTRLDVLPMLGLDVGEAHIVRNAGGIVTDDALRSIVISQRKLATTEIAVVQHSKCGLLGLHDDEFWDEIEADTGQRPDFATHGFDDFDESVRRSMDRIHANPFIPHKNVRGFVIDVDSGLLREVTR